eukprot:7077317-Pyramimonas_sp.AAC.1
MTPDELLEHNWLHLVKGVCCAPSSPTCVQTLPGRVLDYFILHRSLTDAKAFSLDVLVDTSLWPHLTNQLQLPHAKLALRRRVLKQPKAFPPLKPGCARYPWCWEKVITEVQQ